MKYCSHGGCIGKCDLNSDLCMYHNRELEKVVGKADNSIEQLTGIGSNILGKPTSSLADLYPKYHKHIPKGWTTIDVYGVFTLFPIQDTSGCIQHALKKLLVPGVRTGGKSFRDDIKEARDTLNRWLELNPE